MYAISNTTHAELLRLLPEMEALKGRDNKTVNVRRRAKLTIQKLKRCKKVNMNGLSGLGGESSDGTSAKER